MTAPAPYIRQGRTSDGRCFLIEDMLTGSLDGWYFDEDVARCALEYHQREFPQGRWMLLEAVLAPEIQIPDHRWHAYERLMPKAVAK